MGTNCAGHGDGPDGQTDDDIMQLWLSDRSQAAADFAKSYLLSHPATGNTVSGGSRIARTILGLLGLDPHSLRAVQIEHTAALPGLER